MGDESRLGYADKRGVEIMTLLIVSHTEHYRSENGDIVGWSATVNEIDALAGAFNKIIHVACLYSEPPPGKMSAYRSSNVEFVSIPPYGGSGIRKFSILYHMPTIIYRVFRELKRATCFQFRAPTAMGVFIIPLLTLFVRKPGWYKYAGNWTHPRPPLSYSFQRFWLRTLQRRKVTINGTWPDQLPHCLSFENPCLTRSDIIEGKEVIRTKEYRVPLTLIFVGRLSKAKGAHLLFDALNTLDQRQSIGEVHIVGDGPMRLSLELLARRLSCNITFHGFMERSALFLLLRKSHLLVLPSDSEGFPKVIAEGWNFGCIPIVSDVSSIGQYVKHEVNGYLIPVDCRDGISIASLLNATFDNPQLREMAMNGNLQTEKFLYSYYVKRLLHEVI